MIRIKQILPATILLLAAVFNGQLLAQDGQDGQNEEAPVFQVNNEIRHITGDLYRASNGAWHSIFLVTDEGIILADPLNPAFSLWLKEQLDERFDVPVRYVIYSHSHFDHAPGAAAFADTATIVAHEGVAINMDGRYPQMPGDMIDRNNNGMIDEEDIMVPTTADPGICGMYPGYFQTIDLDGDGVATPAELQADLLRPDIFYSERMSLTLGGKTVELFHPGKNHGDDMTVVYFPEERTVFATDMIADALVRDDIRSLPSACGPLDGTPITEWIRSYKAVEALDFDIFAGGHGGFFSKEDVASSRQFLEDLLAEVSQAISNGLSLDEMKQQIMLEQYSDWAYYQQLREKNIEAAYLNLTRLRF